jgi:hypothetical protein
MGVSRVTFNVARKGDLPLIAQQISINCHFAIPAREIACLDAETIHPVIKDSAYIVPFKKDDSLKVPDGGGHLHGQEQRAWQILETITYFGGESVLSASTWKNLEIRKNIIANLQAMYVDSFCRIAPSKEPPSVRSSLTVSRNLSFRYAKAQIFRQRWRCHESGRQTAMVAVLVMRPWLGKGLPKSWLLQH